LASVDESEDGFLGGSQTILPDLHQNEINRLSTLGGDDDGMAFGR
jgi:hypothetical protein